MRRRWLLFTAILCAMLVVTTLLASGSSGKVVWTSERDGERLIQRRSLGFFDSTRHERDPALHVSQDFRVQLTKLQFKLPPGMDATVERVERQPITSLQWRYSISGVSSDSLANVLAFFGRQLKVTSRSSATGVGSVGGVCSDGRSEVDVLVRNEVGVTRVEFGLTVLR